MAEPLLRLLDGTLVPGATASAHQWLEAVAAACDDGDSALVLHLLAVIDDVLVDDAAFPIGSPR